MCEFQAPLLRISHSDNPLLGTSYNFEISYTYIYWDFENFQGPLYRYASIGSTIISAMTLERKRRKRDQRLNGADLTMIVETSKTFLSLRKT